MKSRFILWIIISLVIFSILVDLPKIPKIKVLGKSFQLNFPLRLGLDLQGGIEYVLAAKMDNIDPKDRDDALESARNVIERRVNLFGVSEAIVQTSKIREDRRILVQLQGVKESSQAAQLIGKTAQLDFRELPATLSDQEAEATKSGIPLI